MRFSVVSVALFAGAAVAMPAVQQYDTTVYSTKDVTVTSCPPSVTDCPAKKTTPVPYVNPTSAAPYTTSTVYSTSYYTVTSCAPTVTYCPAHSTQIYTSVIPIGTTVCPVSPTSSKYATPPPYPTSAAPAAPPAVSPASPSITVTTYTTCIPTVTSKTITVYPTSAYPSSAKPVAPSVNPTGTISPVAPKPTYTSKPPPFTGAASSVGGSIAFAGIAALAAVFLA